METENPMDDYLLFVFGNLTVEGSQDEIASALIPITKNEKVKFIYGSYHMVVNLETDLPFDELKEYIYETLKSDVFEYFLMPMSDKTSVKLPETMAEHLFDLENDTDKVHVFTQLNVEELKKRDKQTDEELDLIINYFLSNSEFEFTSDDEEDEEDDLIKQVMSKPKQPSIDELLEKIVENGMDSLTLQEKQLLDEYSNEQR
jgi:hypothetical protein